MTGRIRSPLWCAVALVVVITLLATPVRGACPNKCSGHGRCGMNDVCDCMQNWIGGDCSMRQCTFTRAWQDTAQGNNDAHYYRECGNRGTCDRDTGLCECDSSFSGSGCRRLSCPEDCSGHGVCDFIEELAQNSFDKRIAGVRTTKYELWDQEKVMGCRCDPWWGGHSCGRRMCPKGDDQLTPNQVEMAQVIYTAHTASGSVQPVEGYLTYFDPYGNAFTTSAITFDGTTTTTMEKTCADIQLALRRLPNNVLNYVSVNVVPNNVQIFTRDSPRATSTTGTLGGAVASPTVNTQKTRCVVLFKSEPGTTGYQNLLECNLLPHADTKGQQPRSVGEPSATCTVDEVQISANPSTTLALSELTECSGRGLCDYTTGMCKCFTGHMGIACERQEALV